MKPAILLLFAACAAFAQHSANTNCASCHPKESRTQGLTAMAHALSTAEQADILRSHPDLHFQQGPYSYSIKRSGTQSVYSVTDGKEEFSSPIAWAFGLGAAGQTYLLNRNGVWYEGRVSYYRQTGNLDLTVGAQPGVPRNLNEAIGREMSKKGAEECFNCHATGAVAGGNLKVEALTPGIQCERCHQDAPNHVARNIVPKKLSTMSSEETADYCGQCHRTWATIASEGPHNISNVRFQPYRLVNSKCYDAADSRIRCTTCHNPHDDAPARVLTSFDSRCEACHQPGGKARAKLCPVAKSDCASCHMPKVELAQAHNKFTDHWIRIARPGGKVPN